MDVRTLLKVMVKQEASDLYLTVDAPPIYRIHGSTHRTDAPPFTNEQLEVAGAGADARSAAGRIRRKNGDESGAVLQRISAVSASTSSVRREMSGWCFDISKRRS